MKWAAAGLAPEIWRVRLLVTGGLCRANITFASEFYRLVREREERKEVNSERDTERVRGEEIKTYLF